MRCSIFNRRGGSEWPSRNVFRRLFFSMLAFGCLVGLMFPPFTDMLLGVDAGMMPVFFVMCIAAGVAVGAINFALFDVVVSREISRIARGMEHINVTVASAEDMGSTCAEDCLLEVTSSDLIGEVTRSFNSMTEAVGRRINVESTTRELLADLSPKIDIKQVAETILKSLSDVCDGRAALLYANGTSKLTLVSSFGADLTDDVPTEIDAGQGLAQRALETGTVQWVDPAREGLDWVSLSCPLGSFRPEALMLVPLISDHKHLTGLAIIACARPGAGTDQMMLIDAIRKSAAPYIQNAVLHRKLEELAALDELTHLLNRRFGVRRLREEFSRATRHGVPMSVMMFDIDHFKAVNDTFGHDAGDAVLRAVASVLEANIRSGDVVCRYGGEEFLIVAPGMGLNDAALICERLRRSIQSRVVEWRDEVLHVSISAGAAAWPVTHASSPEELVTCADQALYHAKESGRDRVSVHTGEGVAPASAVTAETG